MTLHPRLLKVAIGATALAAGAFALTSVHASAAAPKAQTDTTVAAAPTTAASTAAAPTTAAPTTAAPAVTVAVSNGPWTVDKPFVPNGTDDASLLYYAVSTGAVLTMAHCLANADLITTIDEQGPFTIFAITDATFATVPPETLQPLIAKPDNCKRIALALVMPGRLGKDQLVGTMATVEGKQRTFAGTGDNITIDGAKVIAGPIVAGNGNIYVIDKVLLPDGLS